ncbi:MAG: sugar porter family MFS transporter [Planctomycetia bacterium]|nr:sugar porter family MFS transporter [Planctomycetia bacterium]
MTINKRSAYAFAISFVAAVGGFLFGFDLAVMGAANLFLRDQFQLSDAQFGFTTASATLGCIVGPFMGAWLCDAVGRNRTMIVACGLLGVNAIMTAIAPDIITFNVFRIVGGVGVGLCSIASPMYIAEVAPPRMRGGLGLMYQLAIVVGSIAAPLIAAPLAEYLPDTISWRWMFASEMAAVVPFAVLLFFIPPSPRWLAEKGRFEEAAAVLRRVDGPEYARLEMDEIRRALSEESGTLADLFQPGLRRALLIGLLLAFFNNWTGWSVIGGYVPMLLEMSGLQDRSSAILQYAVTYGFMGLTTFLCCLLADRVGRRPLWMFASSLMAVVTLLAGAVFFFKLGGPVVLVVILLCTVPHGLALGGLPWLMMSEIFPTRIRAKAVALTTTFLWITIYSGAQLFPLLTGYSEKLLGSPGGAFWVFTVICLAAVWFGWKMLPETRRQTLEQIGESWKR